MTKLKTTHENSIHCVRKPSLRWKQETRRKDLSISVRLNTCWRWNGSLQKDTMVQGVERRRLKWRTMMTIKTNCQENMKILSQAWKTQRNDEVVERQPKKTVKQPQSNKRKQIKKTKIDNFKPNLNNLSRKSWSKNKMMNKQGNWC